MKKTLVLSITTISILAANSYDDFMEDLSGDMRTYMKQPTKQVSHANATYRPSSANTQKEVKLEVSKQLKEVKQSNKALEKQVKEVKHEVKNIQTTVKQSNAALVKEVKLSNTTLANQVKNATKTSVKYRGKQIIPVAMINETTPTTRNSFLTIGFGFQGLSVTDDNGFFSENALDDSAIDIKAGYGQYFDVGDTKLFATGGFEYMSLKQADMKAITASINTESNLGEDVTGYIGLKAGYSYLVWDIPQDEAIQSITSSSPLVGVQAGIEYKFTDTVSLVLGADYTKYFHQTEIPNDVLNTSSVYGINISLKFYQ